MKHMVVVYEIEDESTLEGLLPKFPQAKSIAISSGVKVRHLSTGEEAFIPYARWYDETSPNWTHKGFAEYNWLFLKTQENWANDMLAARGHLFLNEVYAMLGVPHSALGAVVGWIYKEDFEIDFGCWEQEKEPIREDAILLDFNVQGPILHVLT